jgi:hypothetical protein
MIKVSSLLLNTHLTVMSNWAVTSCLGRFLMLAADISTGLISLSWFQTWTTQTSHPSIPKNKGMGEGGGESRRTWRPGDQATHTQTISPERCCPANCALNIQNVERHCYAKTTCSCAHIQAHSPIEVEVFLQENQSNALHWDNPVSHIVWICNNLWFWPRHWH